MLEGLSKTDFVVIACVFQGKRPFPLCLDRTTKWLYTVRGREPPWVLSSRGFKQIAVLGQHMSWSRTHEPRRCQSHADQAVVYNHGALKHDTTASHQYNTICKNRTSYKSFLLSSDGSQIHPGSYLVTSVTCNETIPAFTSAPPTLPNSSTLYFSLYISHSIASLRTCSAPCSIPLTLDARFARPSIAIHLPVVKHPTLQQYSSAEEKMTVPHRPWPGLDF